MIGVPLPIWTLTAPLGQVETAYKTGRITREQWEGYFAIWFYSAPRFGDYHGWRPVREVNRQLDRGEA